MTRKSIKASSYIFAYRFVDWFRRAVGIARRPRILIDCMAPFHYHHVKPIVDRLVEDGKVDVSVLETQRFRSEPRNEALISPAHFIRHSRARLSGFDMTISTDLHVTYLPQRGFEVYAPHGAGMKSSYATGAMIAHFGAAFVVGKRREEAQLSNRVSDTKFIKTGFVIAETPTPSAFRMAEMREQLGLRRDLPVVLYAPSWSSNLELILFSEEILKVLASQPYWNVIVRPHPNLLVPELCGGVRWIEIIGKYCRPGFSLADDPCEPAQSFMHLSDAIVGDFSSILFEFLFFDRPIVVHVAHRAVNYFGGQDALEEIGPAATCFEDVTDVVSTIEVALSQKEHLSPARRALLNERYFNVGTATATAVDFIYQQLSVSRGSSE